VPTDIAMVGYDDSEAARTTEVPLTTVRQPSEEMGAAMADILIAVLNGDEDRPRTTILPTQLIIRASA
jgi:DNA-binding LacI/PurR family transcriptional regulator